MLNLLTASETRAVDVFTTTKRSISSLELMEDAAGAFTDAFKREFNCTNTLISIFCGSGNNGGDGLAIARLLKQDGYENLSVKIARFSQRSSPDFKANLEQLKLTGIPVTELHEGSQPDEKKAEVIIDALVGSGLNKPAGPFLKSLIDAINSSEAQVVSVDVPSGFNSEGVIDAPASCIQADLTITFQRPKINFFFPESAPAVKRFKVVPIGLDEPYIQSIETAWKLLEKDDVTETLKKRQPFSHKGSYGHALIIAGSAETMGAALLCADACLHSGAGLTTACIPESGLIALNSRSPEVMAILRKGALSAEQLGRYSSIAFGPGTGKDQDAIDLLKEVLRCKNIPAVFDADALNILAEDPALFSEVPAMSILTPHMKEFDRMFGEHQSWWQRLETARIKAREFNLVILLKNQYSFIVLPDGMVLINPTGNPAMAVGGMGDVLTGMIAAFLAQGYSPQNAATIACYIHGSIGDELKNSGMRSIPPRYLIERIPWWHVDQRTKNKE